MKLALAVLWQTIVMVIAAFGVFVAGMFVPAIRFQKVLSITRTFDYDWIVAVVVVYLLLLLLGLALKRFRPMVVSATISLVLTLGGLLLFTQIGIKDSGM